MTIPRLIALYLPQFHSIPENNAWWGEGFTEWTNVRKATPRFQGHYQPHVPGQLGYYDLRDPSARIAQAELAHEYGIYGFCYYHYWFNGKRLLEAPFNEVLKSGKPDFPFCLCWANENWSRRWDGSDKEILMEQQYSDEDDLNFITDLIPAFLDERYIRVNGKPLLLVYRTGLLPDPKRTTEIWRNAMNRAGVGDLYLVRVENSMDGIEPIPESIGFDAAMEFAPNWGMTGPTMNEVVGADGALQAIPDDLHVRDYSECMRRMLSRPVTNYKLFRGVFPCWDNSARRKNEPTIFINSSPAKYAFWLAAMSKHTVSRFQGDEQLVFINAWNEWGEGCHLEPDEKYGAAYLEATSQVVADISARVDTVLPLVFIIVLNWNGKEDTLECLGSLQKLDYPHFKILVVDNGSTDGSEEAIKASFPSVCFIQTGRNLGYAGGNNVGIKHALSHGADYVWLLNNDTTVDPKALSALVETAKADSRIAFVGSKIYYYDKPDVIWCAGGTIDLAEGGRTDHPGMGQEDRGQFENISDVGYVTGCSILASRDAIAAIGPLPEEYFLYFEETDWNLAAQRKGYRTVVAPASHVWHKFEDKGEYRERFIYYSFRNRVRIVRKYAPKYIFRAFRVNRSLRDQYIAMAPERSHRIRFTTFLAHLDALLGRTGKARWRLIS